MTDGNTYAMLRSAGKVTKYSIIYRLGSTFAAGSASAFWAVNVMLGWTGWKVILLNVNGVCQIITVL